jgi:pimeloyl-ACP methyl ester carboxylesterase
MPHFQSHDGLSLFYQDEGSGPVVLCLAGLTRNSSDFDYMMPHLTGHRVIRPDYRGRGLSDWSSDPLTYSIPVESRDVLTLLDHLGLDKVPIIGTSRGGLIGMVLAATAKDRLLGLCLNDIGPVMQDAALAGIASHLGVNPKFKTQQDMALAMPFIAPDFVGVTPFRWLTDVMHRTIQTGDGVKINYDPKLRDAFLAANSLPKLDLWPMFDALSGLPTALLRAENSDILSRGTVKEMQRRRPDMIYAEVAGRGHVPFLDEPESLLVIQSFLNACKTTAT